MSSQSHSHRDTPLRRFNAFWWGLACFSGFGVISAIVFALSDRAPSTEALNAEQRQGVVNTVADKQAELLTDKEVEPGKVKQVAPEKVFDRLGKDLKKAPAASAVPVPGLAEPGDRVAGGKLFKAKTCFTCHGADGNTPIAPMFPKLGGKDAAYLSKRMKDIKSGAYTTALTPQMMPFISQVSDKEIDDIAAWLAAGSK